MNTASAQELGPYTALTAVGIVGLLSVILFWLITKYIPGKDLQREAIAKDERESREKLLADERESRDRLVTAFSQSVKELREEINLQLREERTKNQQSLTTIFEKIDKLVASFHELAFTIADMSQQESGIQRSRKERGA